MYFESVSSNHLLLRRIIDIIDQNSAIIFLYNTKKHSNKVIYIISEDSEEFEIESKLIFKFSFKFTKKNRLDSRLLKILSHYTL
jgi:hypothetical protein